MIAGNDASILQQSAQPIRISVQLRICKAAFIMSNCNPFRHPYGGFLKKTVQCLGLIVLVRCVIKIVQQSIALFCGQQLQLVNL
ncbi:hypothetical protein D3C80_1754530 [compost metagenome]